MHRHKTVISGLLVALIALGCQAGAPFPPLEPIERVEIGPNQELRVNGEVFLPIIAWGQPAESYPMLRGLGFNVVGAAGAWAPPAGALADDAAAAGMYAAGEFHDGDDAAVDHRHLLAWFQDDEPDMPRRHERAATPDDLEGRTERVAGYEPRMPVREVVEYYRRIKRADPMRPVWLGLTGHFTREFRTRYTAEQQAELYPAYIRGADMVGFNIYPIYGHGRPAWLNRPAEAVAQLRELAGDRPVFAWIETCKGSQWMSYELQPDVLPIHTRYQVWGSLIRGASGVGYFTHVWKPEFKAFGPTEQMQRELARLNGQITRLAPAILAPATDLEVNVTMSDGLASHFKATEYRGRLYIFAQITDLGPDADQAGQFDPIHPRGARATITVPGLRAGAVVEVVDENRTLTAASGRFTDDFEPLSERIYRLPPPR